jgi:hypothetical protein
MRRNLALAVFALALLAGFVSRAGNEAYQPVTKPEQIELSRDRVDVYPDDVRNYPATYMGVALVWAGIIRSTDARDAAQGDKIDAETVFEHHYFNGVQNNRGHGITLFVSPRGEGLFRVKWRLDKVGRDATAASAEAYAAPGKLALVYGVPQKVDPDGTVLLKYRYLRVLNTDQFSTNKFDYGRFGQPFRLIQDSPNSPPATAPTGK